jgi:hypothetical protein
VYLLLLLYILIRFISSLPELFKVDCGNNVGVDICIGIGVSGRVKTTEVNTTAAVARAAWKGGHKVRYELKPLFSCCSSISSWLYSAGCPSLRVLNKTEQ